MRCEVRSPIAGSVWSHVASVGQRVEAGAVLLVVECMKTEIVIDAPQGGTTTWLRSCGETIEAGDVVATLDA
jgi:biotin carboxyl carrier protein